MRITAITRYKHGELYHLLLKLGWSQAELARRTQIHPTIIGKIINLVCRPRPDQAELIQKAFGEAGEFFDILGEWPEGFTGLKKGLITEQTAEVPMENLLSCAEALNVPMLPASILDDLSTRLDSVMDTIPAKEAEAIKEYYIDGKTGAAIGRENNRSREWAFQKIKRGLRRLRHPMRLRLLVDGNEQERIAREDAEKKLTFEERHRVTTALLKRIEKSGLLFTPAPKL
jgi:transcriptional regulator with XRE-family HTH domain